MVLAVLESGHIPQADLELTEITSASLVLG